MTDSYCNENSSNTAASPNNPPEVGTKDPTTHSPTPTTAATAPTNAASTNSYVSIGKAEEPFPRAPKEVASTNPPGEIDNPIKPTHHTTNHPTNDGDMAAQKHNTHTFNFPLPLTGSLDINLHLQTSPTTCDVLMPVTLTATVTTNDEAKTPTLPSPSSSPSVGVVSPERNNTNNSKHTSRTTNTQTRGAPAVSNQRVTTSHKQNDDPASLNYLMKNFNTCPACHAWLDCEKSSTVRVRCGNPLCNECFCKDCGEKWQGHGGNLTSCYKAAKKRNPQSDSELSDDDDDEGAIHTPDIHCVRDQKKQKKLFTQSARKTPPRPQHHLKNSSKNDDEYEDDSFLQNSSHSDSNESYHDSMSNEEASDDENSRSGDMSTDEDGARDDDSSGPFKDDYSNSQHDTDGLGSSSESSDSDIVEYLGTRAAATKFTAQTKDGDDSDVEFLGVKLAVNIQKPKPEKVKLEFPAGRKRSSTSSPSKKTHESRRTNLEDREYENSKGGRAKKRKKTHQYQKGDKNNKRRDA